MTLLGRKDGDDVASGASYLELAEFIMRFGSRPEEDLAQLWRRIVFSIAISNTNDHLRNHGFLREDRGWRLSPAYDLNPDPESRGLSLAIDEHDNSLDFDLALSAAKYFRLSMQDAHEILTSITTAVSPWRKRARALGLSAYEIESMAAAFRPR